MPVLRRLVRRRHGSSPRWAPVALALLLGAGCAASTQVAGDPSTAADTTDLAPAEVGDATLEVVNQSNYDVRVFIHYGGQYRRLGLVTSMRAAQFTLPAPAMGREVRFLADPVGFRRRQRTDAILLRPGQFVRFGLEKELRSHTLVY